MMFRINFLAELVCKEQVFGSCSQYCRENTQFQFGYECYCKEGYILLSDNFSCLAFGEYYISVQHNYFRV